MSKLIFHRTQTRCFDIIQTRWNRSRVWHYKQHTPIITFSSTFTAQHQQKTISKKELIWLNHIAGQNENSAHQDRKDCPLQFRLLDSLLLVFDMVRDPIGDCICRCTLHEISILVEVAYHANDGDPFCQASIGSTMLEDHLFSRRENTRLLCIHDYLW